MELTLTGASLADPLRKPGNNATTPQAISPLMESDPSSTGENHVHGPDCQHGRSHDHATPVHPMNYVFTVPISPELRRQALFELLQLRISEEGDFQKLVDAIVEHGEEESFLSWSDDGHSLAHWASKRREYHLCRNSLQ